MAQKKRCVDWKDNELPMICEMVMKQEKYVKTYFRLAIIGHFLTIFNCKTIPSTG
jgi:hypothetical protein